VFASDIKPSARLQAIEMRNAAKSFLDGPGYTSGTPAAKLDAALRDAPDWLISRLSYRFFENWCGSLLEKEAIEARTELNVDPVVYAASRVGLRTFLRMKAGALSNANVLAGLVTQEVAETEARLAAKTPKERAYSRRFLREVAKRGEFDLSDAMAKQREQVREVPEPVPPVYGVEDKVSCPSGLTLRIPSEKEARVLAKEWEDGWLATSPQNAIDGRIDGITSRVSIALRMRSAGRLLGVVDGETLVGSLVVNRVSETQVELGWFTSPAHRGRGIATAALEGLLADLNRLGIEEVGAQCFPNNQASMSIISKLGFEPLPDQVLIEGSIEWVSFTMQTNVFAPQHHLSM
jgi:RimJ/RimL family protein N-acetyltransferase